MNLEVLTGFVMSFFTVLSAAFLFAFFPLIAVLYGWYTQNRIVAVFLGAIPFPLLMIASITLQGFSFGQAEEFGLMVLYYFILAGIGGLGGYFASLGTRKHLAGALGLTVVWLIVMFLGIN